MATMPDQQCYRGGAVQGRDIYIWNCVDGERVLIEKYSAEMSASAPERYTTACGGVTEFEARERLTDADCRSHRARQGEVPARGPADDVRAAVALIS